jgi:DNA excision repair protein ERCC-2
VDGYMADLYSYFQVLLNGILRDEDGISLVEKDVQPKEIMASQEFRAVRSIPRMLYKILWKFCYFLRPVLDALPSGQIRKDVLAFYFDARFFLTVIEIYFDDSYILSAEAVKGNPSAGMDNELTVTLSCLDASEKIHKLITDQHSAVFFSATLSPTFYYTSMLIGDKNAMDAKTLTLSSPFPPENLSVGILKTIRTTYQERNYSIEKVTDAIFSVTKEKIGNYLIYLPSFAYLKMLSEAVSRRLREDGGNAADLLVQTPSMNSMKKEEFLYRFEQFGTRTLYAFAVLGGHFGEGIDLVGERLSGVLIVGVGLPLLCPQREIMRQYFQEKFGDGFGFAYRFPGWEKVLQAAGRVIRNEEDTGFVFLMDERYDKPDYRTLFPEHWHPQIVSEPEEFELLP